MIRWLADKDPDVWFAVTPLLNWDNAVPVLEWLVAQPQCDKANVASIFWAAGPAFFAQQLAEGKPTNFESWGLIEAILRNWENDFYTRAELAWPDEDGKTMIGHYEQRMRAQPSGGSALPIPRGLFGPIKGRKPCVPTELMPGENVELWDLLDRLGTQAGFRPGSESWVAYREGRLKPYEPPKASLLLKLFGKPNWSPAAIIWLSISAALLLLWVVLKAGRR